MKAYLLLGLGLVAALTGCAVSASVPGASFAVSAPGPVVWARPYGPPRYVYGPPAYARAYVRPRRYWRPY